MDAHFRDDWDSFRFGLGFAETDNYAEMQIVIVYRTKDGASLRIDRYGKPATTKLINKTQLSHLMADIRKIFSNSTSSRKINQDGPFPQFSLILSVDSGLYRDSKYKDITSDKKEIDDYMTFVDTLADQNTAEQGAAANP